MDVVENWNLLNERVKEESNDRIPGLFQIHMGAFDDLRKSGHMLTANGKPVSVLAPSLSPEDRFALACQIGRNMINANPGTIDGHFANIFMIQNADFFPNCIAIAAGAMLENIHPGFPGMKTIIQCNYDTINGNDDPLKEKLEVLAPCFPWAQFQIKTVKKEITKPVAEKTAVPLDQMATIFEPEKVYKIDVARTAFSGSVVRGAIKTGDVLNVTDSSGQQICPAGVVVAIFAKDCIENGKPVGEKVEYIQKGQHVDSMLVAVEIPKGTYSSIILSQKGVAAKPKTDNNETILENKDEDSSSAEKTNSSIKGFISNLFKKRS